jgi:hypothetical protein
MRRFMQQGYSLREPGESAVPLPLCATIVRCGGTFAPVRAPGAGAQYAGELCESLPVRFLGPRALGVPPRAAEQLAGVARAAGDRLRLKRDH